MGILLATTALGQSERILIERIKKTTNQANNKIKNINAFKFYKNQEKQGQRVIRNEYPNGATRDFNSYFSMILFVNKKNKKVVYFDYSDTLSITDKDTSIKVFIEREFYYQKNILVCAKIKIENLFNKNTLFYSRSEYYHGKNDLAPYCEEFKTTSDNFLSEYFGGQISFPLEKAYQYLDIVNLYKRQ